MKLQLSAFIERKFEMAMWYWLDFPRNLLTIPKSDILAYLFSVFVFCFDFLRKGVPTISGTEDIQ